MAKRKRRSEQPWHEIFSLSLLAVRSEMEVLEALWLSSSLLFCAYLNQMFKMATTLHYLVDTNSAFLIDFVIATVLLTPVLRFSCGPCCSVCQHFNEMRSMIRCGFFAAPENPLIIRFLQRGVSVWKEEEEEED